MLYQVITAFVGESKSRYYYVRCTLHTHHGKQFSSSILLVYYLNIRIQFRI